MEKIVRIISAALIIAFMWAVQPNPEPSRWEVAFVSLLLYEGVMIAFKKWRFEMNKYTKYQVKYHKDHYKRLVLDLKPETKQRWQDAAEKADECITHYVKKAVEERIKEEGEYVQGRNDFCAS